MSSNYINVLWQQFCNYVYLTKLVLLTVVRHHFPVHHKALKTVTQLRNPIDLVVTTKNGKLRGRKRININDGLFYSFQGIPYAKPPIGNLRFKAPQPPDSWGGIRDALHEGSDCVQRHTFLKTIIGSEDCLTLNVYTPELPKDSECNNLKPVMVWIHGGGFTSGSGSTEVYGPEFLLTEDVVLVTINYRTGILGFLSLEDPDLEVPGNAGLKDMVMALKWVQANIHSFSGNPNNVTIFGESAGGAAAHYLILSPLAKGLFHKAILQSGCALNCWARGRIYSKELAEKLALDTWDEKSLLKILRDLPADKLYKVAEKVPDPFLACSIRPHGPVIERKSEEAFIFEDPLDIIKSGNYNQVPIMVGFTTREGMLGEILQKPRPFKPITDFEVSVPYFLNLQQGSETSKLVAEKIKEFYYEAETPSTENKQPYYLLETDNFFVRELLSAVNLHLNTTAFPIFLYRISIETSLNMLKKIHKIAEPGVCHADELGYLFKNLLTSNIEPGSVEDIAVKRFLLIWTNFAKNGNPNPDENNPLLDKEWKPVTKEAINFLDIGKNLTLGIDPEEDRMEFWNDIFAKYSKQ